MEHKRCLSSLTLEELADELKAMGQPAFRAKQIFHWVHQKLVTDFSAMTDQPKTLIARLSESFYIAAPDDRAPPAGQGRHRQVPAADGRRQLHRDGGDALPLRHHRLRLHPGGLPDGLPVLRLHPGGPGAQLEAGEICSEIYTAQKDIGERVSHIVLMGIGEPLDNFDEVMKFLSIISSPDGVNIGMRNISLSPAAWCPRSTGWPSISSS